MAGLADFEVPSYLQPISPVQQAQINVETANVGIRAAEQQQQARMQQQLMQQRDIEMKQRLSDIMERKQTMAKIQADAMRYSAMPNMDPQSALDHAMLDNAQSLWKEHPEAMAQGTDALIKRIRHHEAVTQFQADSKALLSQTNPDTGEKYTPEEATMEAYWKNIGNLDETATAPGSLIGTAISRQQTAEWRKRTLQRMQSRDAVIAAEREKGLEIQAGVLEQRKTEEAGRGKRFEEAEKGKEERSRAERLLKAQKDPRLTKIETDLGEVERSLADVTAYPRPWKSKPANLEKAIKLLKTQRDERLKELGLEPGTSVTTGGETPVAAPKQGQAVRLGTLVEQGGKRYRYQGGDVNDPQSWVEVK